MGEVRDGSERRCKRPAIGADGRSKLRMLVVLRSSGTGVMIWHSLGTQDLHAACTRRRLGTAAQHSQLLLLLLGTTRAMYNSERVSQAVTSTVDLSLSFLLRTWRVLQLEPTLNRTGKASHILRDARSVRYNPISPKD